MENLKPNEVSQTNVPSLITEVLKKRSETEEVQLRAQEMVSLIKKLFHQNQTPEEPYQEPASEEIEFKLGNGKVIKGRSFTESIFSPKKMKRMDYYHRFGHYPSEYLHFTIDGKTVDSEDDLKLTIEADCNSDGYFVTFTGLDEKLVVGNEGAYLESLETELVGELNIGGHNSVRPEWQTGITLERLQQYEELINFASSVGAPQLEES